MAHSTSQGSNLLKGFKRIQRFDQGLGAQLPEAYKKFWKEWKQTTPAAVHYIPKDTQWQLDPKTNEVTPVQDVPLPLVDPPESHTGIWGGEAVIKGFQKRNPLKRRVPHYWVPVLRRSVVYSEVLKEYMSMVVTDRTMDKIHESRGFDHYLLKNLACDLRSTLALKLKRKILKELFDGCPLHKENQIEQKAIMKEYQRYLEGYTAEEIEWYGHTYDEALKKLLTKLRAENPIVPHKVEYRSQLIEKLKEAGVTSIKSEEMNFGSTGSLNRELESTNWLSKIGNFGKKTQT